MMIAVATAVGFGIGVAGGAPPPPSKADHHVKRRGQGTGFATLVCRNMML
jgi:hypothetical protein